MARKRELIKPHKGDKRYLRRDEKGHFMEVDSIARPPASDQHQKAKSVAKKGLGDKGDRPSRRIKRGEPLASS